ncbi:hypothetical protein [Hanstruepera ponticola]|uniref:hypothetical protein n=1 Tax=Hanstruepera ponticola TaxID=2042995 RepID=UPI001781C102|nr:hypothetical protein [Hanstruepera ponticola]
MTESNKPAIWFWIVSIVALLWNLMGVNAYIQQAYRTEAVMSQLTTEQIALLDARPAWVTALFAIAVFAGAIGCLLLLLKKKLATSVLTVSFLAATIQQIWWFTSDGPSLMDQFSGTIMPIMIIVVCALLVWFSRTSAAKGWIS